MLPVKLGVFSFGDVGTGDATGGSTAVATALDQTIERIQLAEQVGLSFYGVGEHHLEQYAVSSPATVLAAAARVTSTIALTSSVTVLSTDDPVRLYQQFTTLDQLSHGRAEMIAGRGSFTESFPLFGSDLRDYDALYDEKLALLLQLDRENPITWSGRFRPPLDDVGVFPRPYGEHLRITVGTGGNPASSVRAGRLGLPVTYAIIGGQPERFAPLVEVYRRSSEASGHARSSQYVTIAGIGLIARRSQDAKDSFYPYWRRTMEDGARARGWRVPDRSDYDHYTDGARDLFVGSPNEIADRIITVSSLVGADRYALQMDWSGVPHDIIMKSIELLGTAVRPQVETELATARPSASSFSRRRV